MIATQGQLPSKATIPILVNNSGASTTNGCVLALDASAGTAVTDMSKNLYIGGANAQTNNARLFVIPGLYTHGSNVPAIGQGLCSAIVLGPVNLGEALVLGTATNATHLLSRALAGAWSGTTTVTAPRVVATAMGTAASGVTALVSVDFYGSMGAE